MALRYNKKNNEFIILTGNSEDEKKRAEQVGLNSRPDAFGPKGELVYTTNDNYAALAYYRDSEPSARGKLSNLWSDYEESWATDCADDYPIAAGWTYRPFQRAGIKYALKRDHVLIGDQPGLGKSIQAVGISNAIEARNTLIVCPAQIRRQWRDNVKKWTTIDNCKVQVIQSGGKGTTGISAFTQYTIISYDLTRNAGLWEALYATSWDHIIIDEAHALKTPDAGRTRAMFGGGRGTFKDRALIKRAKRVTALTGTPLPNRPRECYTLARGLCFESIDWMSYDEFCYRYNPSGQMDTGAFLEDRGRLPELQSRLRCNFMVRRLKEDVLKDLPAKQYELSYVEPSGKISDVLAKEKLIHFDLKDLKDPWAEIWGQVSTVRREMGEAMAPSVALHARYQLEDAELPKIIIFCHHKSVMDYLAAELEEFGVTQIRGGMSDKARDAAVQRFIKVPECRVFLGQMQASGEGIDGLQAVCSHCIFAEPSWVPKDNEQCVDRLHRMGQLGSVVAQLMVVEGSISERILGTTFDKSHTIHETLDNRRTA